MSTQHTFSTGVSRPSANSSGRIVLSRASGAAIVIARIAAVFLALCAIIQLVIVIIFIVDMRSFQPDYSYYSVTMDAGIGPASITGHFLDSDIRLADWTTNAINVPVTLLVGLEHIAIYTLLTLVFGELSALLAELRDWMRDRVRYGSEVTPFRTTPIERLERIGWYLIAVPVTALIVSLMCMPFTAVAISGGAFTGLLIMLGIVSLMFAQVFNYGAVLQNDVEGLL